MASKEEVNLIVDKLSFDITTDEKKELSTSMLRLSTFKPRSFYWKENAFNTFAWDDLDIFVHFMHRGDNNDFISLNEFGKKYNFCSFNEKGGSCQSEQRDTCSSCDKFYIDCFCEDCDGCSHHKDVCICICEGCLKEFEECDCENIYKLLVES